MHRKKGKGSKKKGVKSKIKKVKDRLALSQASTRVENDKKLCKGSKKKGVKSKIKKVKNRLALGQASTRVENDKKLDKDELLDVTPLDKRLKGSSMKRQDKKPYTLMLNKNTHACKVCSIAFKTVVTLKNHLSYYGDPTYPCEECGTKFADEKQLEYHIDQAHLFKPLRECKFQCPLCSQFFNRNYSLRSHMCHYHEEWEILYPNLFASEADTTTIITAGPVEKHKKELKNENHTVRRSKARVAENIKECTTEPENHENVSSSTVTLENNNFSTLPLDSNASATIPPETKSPSTMQRSENDISEKILPEQNTLSTIPSENNFTTVEGPDINVNKIKALANEIIETMVSAIDTPENNTVNFTDTEATVAENDAVNITVTEIKSPESNITETTVPESDVTETMAPENNITETKSSGKNISETKSPKDNTSEMQGSETNATAPPIDFQNHIIDENNKEDESSRLDGTIFHNEKDTFSQKVTVQSDISVNDRSAATSVVSEEKDQNGKSLDRSQHPEEVEKTDENSFIESNSANAVVPVAGELNRDDAATDGNTIQIDREAELHALHSCKDCYVPLVRLNVNRKKKRRRGPAKNTKSRSPGTLFTRKPVDIAPLNDLSVAKPKYCKIVSSPTTLFPCEHCTESFNTHASRLMHIELRHTVVPSIVCDKTFSTRQAMLRHYRERHFVYTENKTFCVCGMQLVGQTAIHRHFYQNAIKGLVVKSLPEATHSACNPLPTNFGCDKCGATFWLKTCLQYHRTLDCERSKPVVSKYIAATTCVRKRYKRRHRVNQSHMCTVCDTLFSSAQHQAIHEAKYSRRERHQCKLCGTVFNGTRLLSGHIQTTHKRDPSKRYPYYCRICDQGFTVMSAERMHRKHFHRDAVSFVDEINESPNASDSDPDELPMTDSDVSDDETTRECDVCGHEFTSGQRFVNHLVYYTRREIIECGICLEEFAGQYQAHRHNKLVHYTSESRDAFTHYCTICREGFMWSTHLHAHLCHVHGVPAIEAQCMINLSDSRRNNSQKVALLNVADTCKICDVTFPSPVLLAAHEIENLNDGEFVCNKCSRRCRTASILLDHLSLNHSSTIIQDGVKCRRCNERFQTRSAWVSHVKHFHFSKEPSEFYFEKNIASSEKFMRSLRYELNVPTNSSISSGLTSFRIRSSFGDSSHTPETIVPDKSILENADVRHFIKIEGTPKNECNNGQIVRSDPESGWKCAICLMKLRGPAELARHTALFSDEGQYMCELCGRRFAWLSIYEEHKKKHYRNDIGKFFCPTCNEGFETLQSKTSHEAHLHKRSPGLHRNEDQSTDNSQQLKSPNRSFPHPKLPSIVSFFQSGSANEQRSNRYVLGLPDQRKPEEQRHVTSSWPRLHTEIFEDELSMSYQCPDCQEKYPTLEGMHEHLTIAHNMKQDPSEDALADSSADLPDDSPEESSVDLPGYSPVDFHENSPVHLPADSPEVSSIFIDFVKCEICDMHFVSENLLNVHKKTMHPSCPVVVRKIGNTLTTVGNDPSGRRLHSTYDHTYDSIKTNKLLPNGQVRNRRHRIINRPDQTKLSKPWEQASSNNAQRVGEATSTSGLRDSVKGTSENFQVQVVGCGICDIVFMNKKVLRAHEVNIHGLIVDDNQPSDDSSNGESAGSSSAVIQQLSLFVGKLPITSTYVDANAVMDFESVMIPVTTYDFNVIPRKTEKGVERPKPIEDSFSNSNVDCLPAGNYKVSQLKVRPFARNVKKLQYQNVHKLSMGEPVESTEPALKRIKKVFDPIAYRELCEQHNLPPPDFMKSRVKLPATELENTCTSQLKFSYTGEERH